MVTWAKKDLVGSYKTIFLINFYYSLIYSYNINIINGKAFI
jgi:hypothetical protein